MEAEDRAERRSNRSRRPTAISEHEVEALGQEKADGAGRDQHGDDEDDADGLQGSDDGQGEQGQQAEMQQADGQADGAGMGRVEAIEQQVAPLGEDDRERRRRR